MGRAAKPAGLKLVEGDKRKGRDQWGHRVPVGPAFTRVAPQPPPEVAGDVLAVAAWNRWGEHLERLEVIREVDFAALAQACLAYAHFVRIEAELQRQVDAEGTGAYLAPTRDGTPTVNPLWRVRDQANTQLERALRQLGLTPASEHVLGKPVDDKPPDSSDNPFA